MTWIDERGRIFGKVNLIDGCVVLFCCLLLPLGYGAYRLFRLDPPTITSFDPFRVNPGASTRITITGTNLRPFLIAQVGSYPARFLLESTEQAELELPSDLPVGTYSVRLLDQSNTVLVKPGALLVVDPLPARVIRPTPIPPITHDAIFGIVFDLHHPSLVRYIHLPDHDGDRATLLHCEAMRATPLQQTQGIAEWPCGVRVRLTQDKNGWTYNGAPLVIGSGFEFHGQHATLNGWVESEMTH